MADVSWIKLYTDMFTHSRKIKKIENMDNGDTYLVIWIKLLLLAGVVNDGGAIYVTRSVAYDIDDLAYELRKSEDVVETALSIFESFDMIERDNGYIYISSWEEYQNIEGMDKIREQNRLRQAKYKKKQRLISANVTDNVTVTRGNDTELEKELEKDITTTTTGEAPMLTTVYLYFKEMFDGDAVKEAEKFHAYNANRGWDCLPNWKATADLWIARTGDKGTKQ